MTIHNDEVLFHNDILLKQECIDTAMEIVNGICDTVVPLSINKSVVATKKDGRVTTVTLVYKDAEPKDPFKHKYDEDCSCHICLHKKAKNQPVLDAEPSPKAVALSIFLDTVQDENGITKYPGGR